MKRNHITARSIAISLLFGGLALLLLLPILVTISSSMMAPCDLDFYYFGTKSVYTIRLFPDNLSFSQYSAALWKNTDYTRALLNSLFFATASTALSLLISLPAAYALAHCHFRFSRPLLFLLVLLMIIPYQAIEIPQYLLLRKLSLLGSDAAVILTHAHETFEAVLLFLLFSAIPHETIEQAAIDGAGLLRTLFLVVLPQVSNGIFLVFFLKFVNAMGLTEQPLLFLADATQHPLSLSLPTLVVAEPHSAFGFSFVLMAIPLLLAFSLGGKWKAFLSFEKEKSL